MYDQGFAQVSGAYQGINRELTNPVNNQIRDKFLKEAMGNLKDLSSMDLSEQQNVQAATNVFTPFVKNQSVLRDMGLTQHWNTQLQQAEGARNRDSGKEFSQDNLNYILQQKQAFANDNPDNWQTYDQSKRYFTPYYDYTKEYKDAMKDFKPTSIKTVKENGLYLNTIDDKSWNEREISKYLNGVLSPKAKEQMRIEASVRLGNDPNLLATEYSKVGMQELGGLKDHVQQLETSIKTEKDPTKLAQLTSDRDYYLDRGKSLTNTLSNIQKGDLSFINKNKESLAYQLYYGQTIKKASEAYAHKDIDQSIGFDQVKMMYARFNHDEQMAKYSADRADERELKKQGKLMGSIIPLTVQATQDDQGLDSLKKDVKSATDASVQLHNDLLSVISAQLHNGDASKSVTPAEYDSWTSRNKTNPKFQASIEASQKAEFAQDRLKNYSSGADTYAKQSMGNSYAKLEAYNNLINKLMGSANTAALINPLLPNNNRGDLSSQMGIDVRNRNIQGNIAQHAQDIAEQQLGLEKGEGLSLRKDYEVHKKQWNANSNTAITENGYTLNEKDPRYVRALNYLSPLSGLQNSDISQIVFIDKPTGLDIGFRISDAATNKTTGAVEPQKIMDLLTVQFKGAKVTKDNSGLIRVSNLGSTIAAELDPYAGVKSSHRVGLQNLERSHKQPGGTDQTTFVLNDPSGNPRSFRIAKVFSNDQNNDSYYVYGDGTTQPIFKGTVYDNIHDAYLNTANLITQTPSANLDQYFNNYKK